MKQENNTPEWVKAARQWQNEDTDTRSIIIITSDKNGMVNVADGLPLLIINSIFQNIQQNPTSHNISKTLRRLRKEESRDVCLLRSFPSTQMSMALRQRRETRLKDFTPSSAIFSTRAMSEIIHSTNKFN